MYLATGGLSISSIFLKSSSNCQLIKSCTLGLATMNIREWATPMQTKSNTIPVFIFLPRLHIFKNALLFISQLLSVPSGLFQNSARKVNFQGLSLCSWEVIRNVYKILRVTIRQQIPRQFAFTSRPNFFRLTMKTSTGCKRSAQKQQCFARKRRNEGCFDSN